MIGTLSAEFTSSDPMSSDEVWVEMLKNSYLAECQRREQTGVQKDLRNLEVEAADRKALWAAVKASYTRRKDTPLWAAVVFFVSGLVLFPFTGESLDLLLSIMISAIWTAVHRVRRV